MKSNDTILNYLDNMLHSDDYVKQAQNYIKENFNVCSDFDNATSTLYIYTRNINESLNIAAAEEYLENTLSQEIINIKLGKKE